VLRAQHGLHLIEEFWRVCGKNHGGMLKIE
jgi:hypothetical protein